MGEEQGKVDRLHAHASLLGREPSFFSSAHVRLLKKRVMVGGAGSYMLHLTVSHFFDDKWVHVGSWAGWMVIISNIVNALAASIYFPFVVRFVSLDFVCGMAMWRE